MDHATALSAHKLELRLGCGTEMKDASKVP